MKRAFGVLAALLLSACAAGKPWLETPPAPTSPQAALWSGRMVMQVDSDPPQAWFASFELTGQSEQGSLSFFNPLGMRMAQIDWDLAHAQLKQGEQTQQAPNLNALVYQLTGTQLPTTALLSWLSGRQAQAPGWTADMSQWAQGRLVLERLEPPPRTVLRIALER